MNSKNEIIPGDIITINKLSDTDAWKDREAYIIGKPLVYCIDGTFIFLDDRNNDKMLTYLEIKNKNQIVKMYFRKNCEFTKHE